MMSDDPCEFGPDKVAPQDEKPRNTESPEAARPERGQGRKVDKLEFRVVSLCSPLCVCVLVFLCSLFHVILPLCSLFLVCSPFCSLFSHQNVIAKNMF